MVKYYLADVREVLERCDITALDGRSALEVYEEYYEKQIENNKFSLVEFGEEFGLKFNYANFKGKLISGYLKDQQIVINETETSLRQRFTIAHELGHYFYNHEPKIMDPKGIELLGNKEEENSNDVLLAIARDGEINKQELEANEFAGALLMPEALVQQDKNYTHKWILFGVTETIWNIRIDNLQK